MHRVTSVILSENALVMVGLVLVSHSRQLVEALIAFTRQVNPEPIPIAGAGGVGHDHQEFGTDVMDIVAAIQSVYSDDGVVVLMDLGSAILSAEMARELLPKEQRSKITYCPAPLVEGSICAALHIGMGASVETICREARQAILLKTKELSALDSPHEESSQDALLLAQEATQIAAPHREMILTIATRHGLHARPAAQLVKTSAAFDAEIYVARLTPFSETAPQDAPQIVKGPVPGNSLSRLATLGIVCGDRILLSASGHEAEQALEALRRIIDDNFGENDDDETCQQSPQADCSKTQISQRFSSSPEKAIPVAEGIASGPIFQYQTVQVDIPEHRIDDPEAEWDRLLHALSIVKQAIIHRRKKVQLALGEVKAAIFDVHHLILEDSALLEQVRLGIFQRRKNVAAAWNREIQQIVHAYQSISDKYLQQRAIDVADVGLQVLSALLGTPPSAKLVFPEPVILVTEELTPTSISQLDVANVCGIVTVVGGPTSHSAILARALGIPSITGVEASVLTLPTGTPAALDGFIGNFWVNPETPVLEQLHGRQTAWQQTREQLLASSHQPALTRDGHRMRIAANAGSELDVMMAMQNGAESIGLFRTEFLYLGRDVAPSEDEQVATFNRLANMVNGAPIYIRTLDAGGDKPISYLEQSSDANPFLGVRSIRYSLRMPKIFLTQLRAVLRADRHHDVRLMFPMISRIEDFVQARRCLEQAHTDLTREGIEHRWPIKVSIMVETPSAVLLSAAFAREVDYFSIGTNDLTQYTFAAERGNPELTEYNDALHPVVLQQIQFVVEKAHQHGKNVGVCGELAGDPLAAPILVGLGVNEFSINPSGIPRIKDIVRKFDLCSARILADRVLQTASAVEVRRLAGEFLENV